ncbi:MAG: septal ring lytic transglycosylase RlpA family protein [Cytophagaceae bacterium]
MNILLHKTGLGLIILTYSSLFTPLKAQKHYTQKGMASYYAKDFQGKKTACGEKFDMNQFTAAHKKLPFNTLVKVTNLKNNKSVIVRINDRGPYSNKRIIDLSKAAASRIDLVRAGVGMVKIEVVGSDDFQTKKKPEEPCIVDTTDLFYNTLNDYKAGHTYNTEGKISPVTGYTIQIAALNQIDHTTELVQNLHKDHIKNIYIDVRLLNHKKIYKVLIGDFSEIEPAQDELEKLTKAGYNGFIKKMKVE